MSKLVKNNSLYIIMSTSENIIPNRIKNINSSNTLYGKYRLNLSKIVGKILNNLEIKWFIESGTLMGAWRNNRLIDDDDDFDIAIILDDVTDISEKLLKLNNNINSELPLGCKSRIVSSYCHKLEVYIEQYGKYILPDKRYGGADFHHVTVDLQVYGVKYNTIYPLYYLYKTPIYINQDYIYPLKSIHLEDDIFNSPNNPEQFLTHIYGYLGKDYVFNEDTCKYEKANKK